MSFYGAPAPHKGYKLQVELDESQYLGIAERLSVHNKLEPFDERVPHYQLSVIEHNSTYVEMVDRNYGVRGIAAVLGLLIVVVTSMISRIFFEKPGGGVEASFLFYIFIFVFCFAFSVVAFFILRVDCFRYTHYPVRFNRKNRQVYVWRKNGSVWKVGWDELFFFIRRSKDMGGDDYDVVGMHLSEDQKMVNEAFVFADNDPRQEAERAHFEYFRRYMEEGPEQTHRMLKICLPIAKRRETLYESYMRTALNITFGGIIGQLLTFWWNIPIGLFRWLSMRTNKIPRWPEWVEQECAIEANDPYVREAGYVYKADKKS